MVQLAAAPLLAVCALLPSCLADAGLLRRRGFGAALLEPGAGGGGAAARGVAGGSAGRAGAGDGSAVAGGITGAAAGRLLHGVAGAGQMTQATWQVLQSIAGAGEVSEATKQMLDFLCICGWCREWQRWGGKGDGGYPMCLDAIPSAIAWRAISLGVSNHDAWTLDALAKCGKVDQYDCTVDHGADCSAEAGCTFHKECIAGADAASPSAGASVPQPTVTLEQLVGADEDRSIVMKIDVEGAEWAALYVNASILRKFKQIVVEFHGLENRAEHERYAAVLQRILSAGFQVAHLHGNNYGGLFVDGSVVVPTALEVTFVHGAQSRESCSSAEESTSSDAKNNPDGPDIPLTNLAY